MYSLELVELKILKIDIVIKFANNFICFFTLFLNILTILISQNDKKFSFYFEYEILKTPTIYNFYLLFPIDKSLYFLQKAKDFTYFALNSAYNRIKIKKIIKKESF